MFAPSKETNPEQMNYYDMEPTAFKGMSKVIGGRPLTEAEQASGEFVGGDICGLPLHQFDGVTKRHIGRHI